MSFKTPVIGMAGRFTLVEPWMVSNDKVYSVAAHRTFDDYIKSGLDPIEEVYAPVELGESTYKVDVDEPGILVVILVSEDGDHLAVPNKYIADYPDTAITPHSWFVVTASLGVLPDDYDFGRLQLSTAEHLSEYLGVEPTVFVVKRKTADVVTEDMANQLYAIRQAAIRNRGTTYADKLYLEQQVLQLRAQIDDLLSIIEDLQS